MTYTEAKYALMHNPDEFIKEVERRGDALVEAHRRAFNLMVLKKEKKSIEDNTDFFEQQKDEEVSYMLEKMNEIYKIPKSFFNRK